MIYDSFGFGLVLGMLIGSLSYLIMHKVIISDYDKRENKMINNLKDYMDKRIEEGKDWAEGAEE